MSTNFFDVIIVGAGLSGIGMACHLQQNCPGKTYAILEGRGDMGGTWDLFRYPGIRSDSDMHTLGYNFKPWRAAKAIADGPDILSYIKETAKEHNVEAHIHFNHMVKTANWSDESCTWELEIDHQGEKVKMSCNFLSMCSGYYSYKQGHSPKFPHSEDFTGQIIHPQQWPEDLDYANKKVVVIGSGATAITIVPSMAETAEHVTMLQRSPTYIVSRPSKDIIANFLRKILPEKLAYAITRWKNVFIQRFYFKRARNRPQKTKDFLLKMTKKALGNDYDVDKHFSPHYKPWDQRVCLVPDGDLFKTIKSGKVSVETDTITRFTPNGILLDSGKELPADIIVTATGLSLIACGGIELFMNGEKLNFSDTYTYRGLMYSDVPNFTLTFGYVNASWTLRADIIAGYICRIINHMDHKKATRCTPRLRKEDENMASRPFIEGFTSGYLLRVMDDLPKQGSHEPWTNPQDYKYEKAIFSKSDVEDGVLTFDTPQEAS
ncbi:flavin-containing monooxygenase [Candidatus Uabimicrobium amorphum]|uniref:Cyclohexanone monooxygenase n=1 Tax=Uabimicrobium amorphum TaxID=2596890 RepID=A0A5S9IL92_UABAM|nr:NAD(P)/FAD-dependent oxidoreductase [Candidatus Uabimicrobium amorphum]BBM83422.1 cyclohexanone monooxygenase [Candidatus Uabimicrobium amorphum]